jgi:thiol-disulfide isomerase/thioredoxin
MYAEAGDKAKALEFLTSALARVEVGPQASEELKFAARSLTAAARRIEIVGTAAPPIEGIDYIDLESFKLEDQRGKVVLLDFFAHSCAPCVADLPKLDALEDRYRTKGLKVVVVASYRGYFGAREKVTPAEELTALKKLKEERRARAGFVIGPRANFETYGVVTLPAIALVDRAGKVRVVKRYPKMEEIEETVRALTAEPVPTQ